MLILLLRFSYQFSSTLYYQEKRLSRPFKYINVQALLLRFPCLAKIITISPVRVICPKINQSIMRMKMITIYQSIIKMKMMIIQNSKILWTVKMIFTITMTNIVGLILRQKTITIKSVRVIRQTTCQIIELCFL